jgi:hypothetical protein
MTSLDRVPAAQRKADHATLARFVERRHRMR